MSLSTPMASKYAGATEMNQNTAKEAVLQRSKVPLVNHQPVGGVIGEIIWHAENEQRKDDPPPPRLKLCRSSWHVENFLYQLKRTESSSIAERVIICVGFEECRTKYFEVKIFLTILKRAVSILRQKGCRDMVVTNVPPDAASSRSVRYWRTLESLNAGIEEICKENGDLFFCNIFHLFCVPKNFLRRREYVVKGVPNYDLKTELYDMEIDIRTYVKDPAKIFSNEGKQVLHQHVRKTLICRKTQLMIPNGAGRGKNSRPSRHNPKMMGLKDLSDKLKTFATYRPDTIAYEMSKLNVNHPSKNFTSHTEEKRRENTTFLERVGGVERRKRNSTCSHLGSEEQEIIDLTSDKRTKVWPSPSSWSLSEAEREVLKKKKKSSHPFYCECWLCQQWHRKILAKLGEITDELDAYLSDRSAETTNGL